MATLHLAGLSKRFGTTHAVQDVHLEVASGEFVALLGPSGCGKSTTLAMIAGFEQPDAGHITVDGRSMIDLLPQARSIGVVLQDYAIFPRMTVEANIAFGLAARGVPRRERNRRAFAMAERLGILPLLQRLGSSLDLSDMQRVAIARTLVTEPAILLLDEPLSNLDAAVRAMLRNELKNLQRSFEQTILYVTHDQIEAMTLADRIAVMDKGRIVQSGSPRALYEQAATGFVARFLGEPPINLIQAQVQQGDAGAVVEATPFPSIPWQGRLESSGHFLLGIRPHRIVVGSAGEQTLTDAIIEDVEQLGADCALHLSAGPVRLTAVLPRWPFVPGQRVGVGLDLRGAFLVDPATDRVSAWNLEALPS